MKSVSKTFGGIRALDDVSLDLYAKDVVGLVGDNGAGKSTLIKILSGALDATLGEIELDGRAVTLAPPAEAQRLGVETVYQDLSLISAFTAAENVFLGRELSLGRGPALFRLMRRKAMADATAQGLKDLHIEIPGLRGTIGRANVRRSTATGGDRARRLLGRQTSASRRADGGARGARVARGARTDQTP